MKVFNSFLMISLIGISHSSLLLGSAAAEKSAAPSATQAQAALIDVSTKFGKSLNSEFTQLGAQLSVAEIATVNAILAKGKELHQANTDFNTALEQASKEKKEHEVQTIRAGKTCFITSTVNPIKALTPGYKAVKAANCANIHAQFPEAHEKFREFAQNFQLLQKSIELHGLSQSFFENAPVAAQQVVGKKLAELDTLGNLIAHFGPNE